MCVPQNAYQLVRPLVDRRQSQGSFLHTSIHLHSKGKGDSDRYAFSFWINITDMVFIYRCFFPLADLVHSGGLNWDFLTTLKMNGCQEQCATEHHNLHPIDLLTYHNHFAQLSRLSKRQWILDYLNTHSSRDTSSGEPVTVYLIGGKPVCQSLWVATLGFSSSLFYDVRKMFRNGHVRIAKEIQRAPLQRTSEAIAWMDTFFNLIGDHMPHRTAVHLPSSLSKSAVYQRMVVDMTGRCKDSIVSLPQFFKVWDEHFHHVTIPKVQSYVSNAIL